MWYHLLGKNPTTTTTKEKTTNRNNEKNARPTMAHGDGDDDGERRGSPSSRPPRGFLLHRQHRQRQKNHLHQQRPQRPWRRKAAAAVAVVATEPIQAPPAVVRTARTAVDGPTPSKQNTLDSSISRLLGLDTKENEDDDDDDDDSSEELLCWTKSSDDDDGYEDSISNCDLHWSQEIIAVLDTPSGEEDEDEEEEPLPTNTNTNTNIRRSLEMRDVGNPTVGSSAAHTTSTELDDYVPSLYHLDRLQVLSIHDKNKNSNKSINNDDSSDLSAMSRTGVISYGEEATTSDDVPSLVDNTVTTAGYDDDEDDFEESDEEEESEAAKEVVGMLPPPVVGHEGSLEKAINAVLQEHHLHTTCNSAAVAAAPTANQEADPSDADDMMFSGGEGRRRDSSLVVARHDSCSTISTTPDTPESPLVISEFICVTSAMAKDGSNMITTTTTTMNHDPAHHRPCICPDVVVAAAAGRKDHPARCLGATLGQGPYEAIPTTSSTSTTTVWPLSFFFVCPTDPRLFPAPDFSGKFRKSKKFVPDPFTVGDFYGDDDEDIRFVPPSTMNTNTRTNQQENYKNIREQEEEEIIFASQDVDDDDDDDDDDDEDEEFDGGGYDYETITTYRGEDENYGFWQCIEDEGDDDDMRGGEYGSTSLFSKESEGGLRSLLQLVGASTTRNDASHFAVGRSSSSFLNHNPAFVHPSLGKLDNEIRLGPRHFSDRQQNLQPYPHQYLIGTMDPPPARHEDYKSRRKTTTTRATAAPDNSPGGGQVPPAPLLLRKPSIGLDGVLPPSRHAISILVPPRPDNNIVNQDGTTTTTTSTAHRTVPPRRRGSSFTVARIEI